MLGRPRHCELAKQSRSTPRNDSDIPASGNIYIKHKEKTAMIDKELLDILACPVCKSEIQLKGDRLICQKCRKYYPIRDGIPVMLIDEAKDLEENK